MKKKGENLATHEDLDNLVAQMKATTEATKAIEARISKEVWDRQRHWELRRDILLEFVRSMRDFDQSILKLAIALKSLRSAMGSEEQRQTRQKNVDEALDKWGTASDSFERNVYLAVLVVDNKTREEFGKLTRIARGIVDDVLSGKNPSAHATRNAELSQQLNVVAAALRQELGIPAILQSNGSLAAPNPD